MNIKPLAGKYLCQIISDLKQTPSGLFIAETIKEKPHRAKIIAVGGQRTTNKGKIEPMSAKVGDIVHFKRVWHRELPKDKQMMFIKEDEIVGVERGLKCNF